MVEKNEKQEDEPIERKEDEIKENVHDLYEIKKDAEYDLTIFTKPKLH